MKKQKPAINLPQARVTLNLPQLLFTFMKTKESYLEIGRGGGKSTIIGWRIKDLVNHLPRAKIGIVGNTFQQLLTRTLPSTVEGLELLGFKKDLHFFVGSRPPKSWKWLEPYQPPLTYDNYIPFYNGAGFQLISLADAGAGRGYNLDAVIGDEAALMKFEKLSNILLTNRGNVHRFDHWLHHSIMFASTTPVTQVGRWFTNQEENARLNPKDISYLIANSFYNRDNLGEDFFRTQKRLLTEMIYNAEIMCLRPGRIASGFYPAFSEDIHTYECSNDSFVHGLNYNLEKLRRQIPDADLIKSAPIDVACDYGAKINCLVSGQQAYNTYSVINAMFVKTPHTIRDLALEFCRYYEFHPKKEVNYFYDHTAIAKYGGPVTFASEFVSVLESKGWIVNQVYIGQAPRHDLKYAFFDRVLKENESNLPKVRINSDKCKYLVLSLQQAAAKEGRNGIEKDKSPERKDNAIDEETTHLSDAFDTLIFSRFKDGIAGDGYYV